MSNRIVISGDWHGAAHWGSGVVRNAARQGIKTIYHVGDFGFMGRTGAWAIQQIARACEDHDVRIDVTPGNHENWATLDELFAENPGQPVPISENGRIRMLPRGYRWEHGGVSFLSLGGAPSIDRDARVPFMDWWPTEAITYGDALRTIEGGFAEVMITHDAPAYPGVVDQIINGNAQDARAFWGHDVMDYCIEGHKILNGVYEAIQPRLLFHGHYHVWDHWKAEDRDCQVVALEMEAKKRNSVILDLDEFKDNMDYTIKPLGVYFD